MTLDGWVIHRVAPDWPLECVVLCPPGHGEPEDEATATMLLKDMDPPIRALGFSDSGKTLVVDFQFEFLVKAFGHLGYSAAVRAVWPSASTEHSAMMTDARAIGLVR